MIFARPPASSGIFFAIWPRRTVDGFLVNGWLHYRYVAGWGWGSCGHWAYTRWIPETRYSAGERRSFDPPRADVPQTANERAAMSMYE